MSVHIFVDESKRRDFVMVAVHMRADLITGQRREMRRHLQSGQRRLHFAKENAIKRRAIMTTISAWPIKVNVYVSPKPHHNAARFDCLTAIASDALKASASRLVIERDQSREISDRRLLTAAMRNQPRPVSWDIQDAQTHEMLWAADAIAYCWPHRDSRWSALVADLDLKVASV